MGDNFYYLPYLLLYIKKLYKYYNMQNLNEFIESYQINEHLIDSAPQMIFIMGLPASGKSTFIEKTLPKIFPSVGQVRTLDSDIQLHKRQKESAMAFAEEIYNAADEEAFELAKRNVIDTFNASPAQKMLGIDFKINTDWDWVQQHKGDNFNKFKNQFLKDYFSKDWAVNFAVRPVAKDDMKEITKMKLRPEELEGMETYNGNDVAVPIVGDDIDSFQKRIKIASEKFVVSIVYLDIPTETSVEKDEGRRRNTGRGVGRQLIESMAEGVAETWRYLSRGGFKNEGIYKMYHYKYVPVPQGWGTYKLEKQYVNTKMIKDFLG
jgi:hypothetical protein